MKIKIIELIDRLANGEEMPLIIRGRLDTLYIYDDLKKDYIGPNGELFFAKLMSYRDKCLNDEIEILNSTYIDAVKQFNDAFNKAFKPVKEVISGIYDRLRKNASEIEEDKDIPLIPDDELFLMKQNGADIRGFDYLDYNFKVLKEKINQIAEEFNEYRKEEK